MKRRDLMTVLGGAAVTAPFAAQAQQKMMPVVGLLLPYAANPLVEKIMYDTVGRGLSETGYTVGQNVAFEWRWSGGQNERLPALAAELVSRDVDVIVTNSTLGALAAKNATSTIPIVFHSVPDPVRSGVVANLARPGGNLTGFTNFALTLAPKLLELLSDLVPGNSMIGLLVNPSNSVMADLFTRSVEEAARAKGVEILVQNATIDSEIETAFASFVQGKSGALIVTADPFFSSHAPQIVALASRHAVPAMYVHIVYAPLGGLISYGVDESETAHQAGVYAGRILNGARPAELPVQRPTAFVLAINLKTAKALGLTVPQSILARADKVIE
jgi:putative ABC transport system substrate-binding protein